LGKVDKAMVIGTKKALLYWGLKYDLAKGVSLSASQGQLLLAGVKGKGWFVWFDIIKVMLLNYHGRMMSFSHFLWCRTDFV
jgi:hypothetical protein